MAARPIGDVLASAWCPTTFDAAVVRDIAATAVPDAPLTGDPAVIGAALNDAAGELLVSLKLGDDPDAAAWAADLARSCRPFRVKETRSGPVTLPAHRVAMRITTLLGVDRDRVVAMLATLRQIEMAALANAAAAAPSKGRRHHPVAEDRWLASMQAIYTSCFGREATIAREQEGGRARGGKFASFTVTVVDRLRSDNQITDCPGSWGRALDRFSDPKRVAGCLDTMRGRRRPKI